MLAQDRTPHRIVFDVTSADQEVWEAALNNVENVQRVLGIDVTEISVVAHGKGIGLVMKTNTVLAGKIARLATPLSNAPIGSTVWSARFFPSINTRSAVLSRRRASIRISPCGY